MDFSPQEYADTLREFVRGWVLRWKYTCCYKREPVPIHQSVSTGYLVQDPGVLFKYSLMSVTRRELHCTHREVSLTINYVLLNNILFATIQNPEIGGRGCSENLVMTILWTDDLFYQRRSFNTHSMHQCSEHN